MISFALLWQTGSASGTDPTRDRSTLPRPAQAFEGVARPSLVGPAFCFMLASVATCVPTIAMATRIIGWRATSIYLIAWLLLAVGGGMLMRCWL
jgi:hypothetical protein